MQVGTYLGLLDNSERQLAEAFRAVAKHHGDEPDILQTCQMLAGWSEKHRQEIRPLIEQYSENTESEPKKLKQDLFGGPRMGGLALLRDLHDLWLLANEVKLCWTVLLQAAQALHDDKLKTACTELGKQTDRQIAWLQGRIKQAAPQALVVA